MKSISFFSLLILLSHAAIWIIIGLIVRNKFETIINYIVRKPIPTGLIASDQLESFHKSVRFIGTLLIIIGICKALNAFIISDVQGFL